MNGTGLTAWNPLHRRAGVAVDLSGNENNGTVNGPTRGVDGKGGLQSYRFDGTDDYVDYGQSLLSSGPASVSVWVKAESWTDGVVIAGHSSEILRTDGGTNTWYGWDANVTGISGTLDEWDHFVMTDDGAGTVYVYKNGTQVGSAAYSPSQSVNWRIGQRDDGARSFTGQIANVRVYGREISDAEIQYLYEAGDGDYAQPPSDVDDTDAFLYYPLDESSGDAIDAWGTNDGTVSGATQGVSGIRDTAYDFDGTDDEIRVSGGLGSFSAFTISAWVKPPETFPGTSVDIASEYDAGANSREYRLWYRDTGPEAWAFTASDDGSNIVSLYSNTTPVGGVWTHVAATFDGSEIRIYVNGEMENSTPLGNLYEGTSDFTVGNIDGGFSPWDGKIDEVRVYSRALDPWEVHSLYRYGTRGKNLLKETVNAR